MTDEAVLKRVALADDDGEGGFWGSLNRAWPSWAEEVNGDVCGAEMVCWGKIAEVGPV